MGPCCGSWHEVYELRDDHDHLAWSLRILQVKLVLQKLAGVNSTPTIALNEAAELLCKHLSVSFCRWASCLRNVLVLHGWS